MNEVHLPRFDTGEVVHHRRYDYRGVVLAFDPVCRASEEWRQGNMTQPDRDQPWYHVVDENGRERYVAEENLEPDGSGERVENPVIRMLFPTFINGKYYRNSLN
jgi:heat shock protein HspQ